MPIDRWTSADHVHLAAVKALCDHWSTYSGASGPLASDPFRPARVPAAPTSFDGPANALPVDGDIVAYDPQTGDTVCDVPWLAVYVTGDAPTGDIFAPQQATHDVEITVRARYGLNADDVGATVARVASAGYAAFCARAAQVCIADQIMSTAAALDPDSGDGNIGFGLVTGMGLGAVLADVSPSAPGDNQGRSVFDATATITVRQMRYRAAGTDGS